MDKRAFYRERLRQGSLNVSAVKSHDNVTTVKEGLRVLREFDTRVNAHPDKLEAIFQDMMRNIGSTAPHLALARAQKEFSILEAMASSPIEKALEEANRQTVQTNPLVRLRQYIARTNKARDAVSVEVSGLPDRRTLARHQIAQLEQCENEHKHIKLAVPSWAQDKTKSFEAVANYHKPIRLSIEIRL